MIVVLRKGEILRKKKQLSKRFAGYIGLYF